MSETNGRETIKVKLEYIQKDLTDVKRDLREVKTTLQHEYVPRELFEIRVGRVEKLVYGMVSLILVGFLTAVITLVLK